MIFSSSNPCEKFSFTRVRRKRLHRHSGVVAFLVLFNQTTSAYAATCATGFSATYANALQGMNKIDAVTAVTPTMANALNQVSTNAKSGQFLKSADFTSSSSNAIISVAGLGAKGVSQLTFSTETGRALSGLQTSESSFIDSASLSTSSMKGVTSLVSTTDKFLSGVTLNTSINTLPGVDSPVVTSLNLTPIKEAAVTSVTGTTESFLSGASLATTNKTGLTAVSGTTSLFLKSASLVYGEADYLTGLTPQEAAFVKTANLTTTSDAALTEVSTISSQGAFVANVNTVKSQVLSADGVTERNFVQSITTDTAGGKASDSTSFACGSRAVAEGANSLATGFGANTGAADRSVAIGANSSAGNNSVAIGEQAQGRGDGAVVVGRGAVANGAGSTALGHQASTGDFQNATAIGADARATRNNQVVVGTRTNTYTMPGITSHESRSAQSGPLELVTTDSAGNLATDGGKFYNTLANFTGRLEGAESRLNDLNRAVRRLDGGVAMAMSLGAIVLPERQNYAIQTNLGFYRGSMSLGLQGVARVNESFTANAGVAIDMNGVGGVGGRLGLQYGW